MPRRLLALVALLLIPVVGYQGFARPTPTPNERVAWTTSRVVGTPEAPPPFHVASPFPHIKLNHPLLLARQPDRNVMFVAEQAGPIYSFEPGPDARTRVFFDPKSLTKLDQTPNSVGFETVYGMAFHPKFAENRYCYICYTLRGKNTKNLPDGSRVSRFKVRETQPPVVDANSEEIVLTYLQGGHNGGDLHFGPDGMLYISTGDTADPTPPDPLHTGQDISDLLSSILRIDVDRRDAGLNYAIPKDNPFVGVTHAGKPARGEVWSYGYRNPWRMSFDRVTGDLWVGDVGWELWELIHHATRGLNAGWSVVEGPQPVNTQLTPGPTPVTPPVIALSHAAAASITGGYVYRGSRFPELVGHYLFADWETRRIWAATLTPDKKLDKLTELVKPTVRVVSFGEDQAGEIYFLDYDAGTLHTLERSVQASHDPSKFPRTLTATGLFSDASHHVLAKGLTRHDVASPQWQDHAAAERFVAIPGTAPVSYYDKAKPQPGNVAWHGYHWHFPAGSVLGKTLSLEVEPGSSKRVETQLLHFDGEDWHPYSYAWRDDQSDADLVPADGTEKTLQVRDPLHDGGKREQTWQFNSRVQCLQCHNAWAETTLGFNLEQLNRPVSTPTGSVNQLIELVRSGVIAPMDKQDKPTVAAWPDKVATLADPADRTLNLEARTKSYLHANCAHCHRFGGGGAVDFELHRGVNLADKRLLRAPTRGTFELPDAKIIAPSDPGRSALLYRMAKFGGGRMPHLGAELPDPLGLALVREWMTGVNPAPTPDHPVSRALLAACDYPKLSSGEQAAARIEAARLPSGPARDLFEGYLPHTGGKRLGPNPRPQAILELVGNADRGRMMFANAKAQCLNCHKVGDEGKSIGPDLSVIARTRSREQLLESVLQPSKQIEAAYQPYLLSTIDGRTWSGTLVRKTPAEVVIRAADGTETRVVAGDVETLVLGKESLMPAGLVADFTAQEAADLLAFLATRK